MNNENAVIQFIGYRVARIVYDCNPSFEFTDQKISYKFNFNKTFVQMSPNEAQENIAVNVYYGDEDVEKAPYRLTVEIAGRFISEGEWQPQWEANAMAIMFPYLRTLVSNITSNSGREPIILPTINIASLFEKKTEE